MESENDVDKVEVMDLYLASYYVLRGCELAAVKCIPTAKSVSCSIVLKGGLELVHDVQGEYFEKRANVNLWDFRSAYNQVNSCVHQAKKSYERAQKRRDDAREGGAS